MFIRARCNVFYQGASPTAGVWEARDIDMPIQKGMCNDKRIERIATITARINHQPTPGREHVDRAVLLYWEIVSEGEQ